MEPMQMLNVTAMPRKLKSGTVGVTIDINVNKGIMNSLDEEDQGRIKNLTDEISQLLAEGMSKLIRESVEATIPQDFMSNFMEYVKKKAETDQDAANVYNIFKGSTRI